MHRLARNGRPLHRRVAVVAAALSLIVGAVLASHPVAAATYYVATDGDDAGSCARDAPCRTIAHGIRKLASGDTLIIAGGEYAESLRPLIAAGTGPEHRTTIRARRGDRVVLKPAADAGAGHVLVLDRNRRPATSERVNEWILFEGLIFDGTNVSYDGVRIAGLDPVDPENSAGYIRMENCVVRNAPFICIAVHGWTGHNEFIGVEMAHCGWGKNAKPPGHGIYISTPGNLVENSMAHNNASYGIHIYNQVRDSRRPDGNIIRNNVAYDNMAAGILASTGDDTIISGNISFRNGRGIQVGLSGGAFTTKRTVVSGNGVFDNRQAGIMILATARDTRLANNRFSGNRKDVDDRGETTHRDAPAPRRPARR